MDRALVTQAISKASHRGEIKTQALNKRQKTRRHPEEAGYNIYIYSENEQ